MAAASDLESKAKEAFVDDDFELAAELYTQAIDAGPATADLYADRAQAHIKLGNYTGTGSALPPRPILPCSLLLLR
jgi:suppressor of G2 allele of SKP1